MNDQVTIVSVIDSQILDFSSDKKSLKIGKFVVTIKKKNKRNEQDE